MCSLRIYSDTFTNLHNTTMWQISLSTLYYFQSIRLLLFYHGTHNVRSKKSLFNRITIKRPKIAIMTNISVDTKFVLSILVSEYHATWNEHRRRTKIKSNLLTMKIISCEEPNKHLQVENPRQVVFPFRSRVSNLEASEQGDDNEFEYRCTAGPTYILPISIFFFVFLSYYWHQ